MNPYYSNDEIRKRDKPLFIGIGVLNSASLAWLAYFDLVSFLILLALIAIVVVFFGYALNGKETHGATFDHTSVMGLGFSFFPLVLLVALGFLVNAFSLNFWIGVPPLIVTLWLSYKIFSAFTLKSQCYSCFKEVCHAGARQCPECGLTFEGDGWKGFKKHWNSEHSEIDTYDHLMSNMCSDHKTKEKKKNPR